MKIHAKLKKIRPIKVEVWRHFQQSFETYETFRDAALAAAYACDAGTSSMGPAENTLTGEKWTHSELMDAGWEYMEPRERG
jgi:hypothetical protein